MSALSISSPYPIITDIDGQPLDEGYIWIGVANLNPITNPILVYWDAALTLPAVQPIRTISGYPANAGTPARLYVDSDYSIQVQNKNGSVVYSAPAATERLSSDLVTFIQAGSGAVQRTAQNKMRDIVSVKDFGAVGDGTTDDTVAIQSAIAASFHVLFPIGQYLISSTINVPDRKKLEFQGGIWTLGSPGVPAVLIKKSTMTTAALTLNQGSVVQGGGILGQLGNTGDGVQLINNSAILSDFYVSGVGGIGVRVGRSDTTYANCNSTKIINVNSRDNGSHGFYVHDNSTLSAGIGNADANAGSLINCTAINNGGDGIKIGRAWWVTVVNALTENNTGWGMNISNVITPPDTVAEARYTNIYGGDFNETNGLGSLNIAGYGGAIFYSDVNQNSVFGGVFNSLYGATNNILYQLSVDTNGLFGRTQFSSGVVYPVIVRTRGTGTNGDGCAIRFRNEETGTVRTSAEIRATQINANTDLLSFWVNDTGSLTEYLVIDPNADAVYPGGNGIIALGFTNRRWSEVFAVNPVINTSDAREKQQVRELSEAERAVAIRLKSLIRAFKWNDAVEKKGEEARIHIGVIAQEVKAAFEAEGLDAHKYGMFCYDQWDDKFEPEYETQTVKNEAGEDVEVLVPTGKQKLIVAAGDGYGVRYAELLAFIISAL